MQANQRQHTHTPRMESRPQMCTEAKCVPKHKAGVKKGNNRWSTMREERSKVDEGSGIVGDSEGGGGQSLADAALVVALHH